MTTTYTLSLGALSLLATQTGPLLTITIHAPSDSAPVGKMTLTVPEWTALVALVDSLAVADRRHAEDRAEIERLRFYETTSAADVIRMLKDEQAEARRLRSLVESWRQESIGRGEAHNEMMCDRDSLRQQVRELTEENEKLRQSSEQNAMNGLSALGHAVESAKRYSATSRELVLIIGENEQLRSDLSAALVSVDAMGERIEELTKECDQLREARDYAVSRADEFSAELLSVRGALRGIASNIEETVSNGSGIPNSSDLAHTAREQGKGKP